jgi:DNA modification methylase
MNEGCGRKIRAKDADLWALMEDKADKWLRDAPVAERKSLQQTLKATRRAHPVEYPCCTIIHGDCTKHLVNLPDRCFDLCVTDPPYGMHIRTWQKHHERVTWDSKYPVVNVRRMIDLARLGSYFFCRWDNLKENLTLPKPKSMLVWTKQVAQGTGDCLHEHFRDYEMAYFYLGDRKQHKFKKRPPSVLSFRPPGNDAHPTQKPVGLIQEILGWYDFETVLDPYMGSGTTALAAKELGKHFLGFEANKKYFNRAILSIAQIGK